MSKIKKNVNFSVYFTHFNFPKSFSKLLKVEVCWISDFWSQKLVF